jgi:flagellar protein FlaF
MSIKAYQKAQAASENPRDVEYRLFGQVTRALMDAENLDRRDFRRLVDAIDWNRRMWSTLAADCTSAGNQLPETIRAQIISLSLWVSRYSSQVVREGAKIAPLIEVNKNIMEGLAPRK